MSLQRSSLLGALESQEWGFQTLYMACRSDSEHSLVKEYLGLPGWLTARVTLHPNLKKLLEIPPPEILNSKPQIFGPSTLSSEQ